MLSEFKSLWRAVGVDHLSEGDVEKYLQNGWLAVCPLGGCRLYLSVP